MLLQEWALHTISDRICWCWVMLQYDDMIRVCYHVCLQWVKTLLQQGNTVVATARDPSQSPGLQDLLKQHGEKLSVTSLEASSADSIAKWAEELKTKVSHIDVSVELTV